MSRRSCLWIFCVEDMPTGLAAPFLMWCGPEGLRFLIYCFQSQWKMCILYFILLPENHHLSLMTVKVFWNISTWMNLIKLWASNTFVWCEHISSLLREIWFAFQAFIFQLIISRNILFYRARHQNFINIWLNTKSHGVNYQSVWTTS